MRRILAASGLDGRTGNVAARSDGGRLRGADLERGRKPDEAPLGQPEGSGEPRPASVGPLGGGRSGLGRPGAAMVLESLASYGAGMGGDGPMEPTAEPAGVVLLDELAQSGSDSGSAAEPQPAQAQVLVTLAAVERKLEAMVDSLPRLTVELPEAVRAAMERHASGARSDLGLSRGERAAVGGFWAEERRRTAEAVAAAELDPPAIASPHSRGSVRSAPGSPRARAGGRPFRGGGGGGALSSSGVEASASGSRLRLGRVHAAMRGLAADRLSLAVALVAAEARAAEADARAAEAEAGRAAAEATAAEAESAAAEASRLSAAGQSLRGTGDGVLDGSGEARGRVDEADVRRHLTDENERLSAQLEAATRGAAAASEARLAAETQNASLHGLVRLLRRELEHAHEQIACVFDLAERDESPEAPATPPRRGSVVSGSIPEEEELGAMLGRLPPRS